MRNIVLISCVKTKLDKPAKAQELYTSALFKYNLRYAKLLSPDAIFILSAQYGLLELDDIIAPYEKTLNKMSEAEKKEWANSVLNVLSSKSNLKSDNFIFLAGLNYRKYLLPSMKKYEVPFIGMSFGHQLQELKLRTS